MKEKLRTSPKPSDPNQDPLPIGDRPEVHEHARRILQEQREQTSRFRRVARAAGTVAMTVAAIPEYMSKDAARTAAKPEYKNDAMMQGLTKTLQVIGAVARPVSLPAAEAVKEHKVRKAEAEGAAHREAARTYRQQNPEEVAKLRRHEANVALWNAANESTQRQELTISHLKSGRRHPSAYSFSKSIPSRPYREGHEGFTGSYDALALNTLKQATATQRQEDGSVALYGESVVRQHRSAAREAGAAYTFADSESAYNEGVATAVWKLGFVEADRGEDGLPYGKMHFNPDIAWSRDGDMQRAQLPFDARNECHRALLPDLEDSVIADNLAVQLEFSEEAGMRAAIVQAEMPMQPDRHYDLAA